MGWEESSLVTVGNWIGGGGRDRDRDGDRQTDRDTNTDRQTDRQTDRVSKWREGVSERVSK